MNDSADAARPSRSYGAMVWAQFKRDRFAVVGLALIVILFAVALAAPLLAARQPVLMRIDGTLTAPLLQEIFAPSENPEAFLERVFNFGLVFVLISCLTVLPISRLWRARTPARTWTLWISTLVLAAACLVPFLLVRQKLDPTDYRALVQEAAARPGTWVIFTPVPFSPYEHVAGAHQKPDRVHLMGTDRVGRDVLARLIHGARVSLSVGFLAIGVAVVIGLFIGATSAYFGGLTDLFVQRLIEVVICFPTFLLILTILAMIEQRSIFNVMLVIGLTGWTGVARLVRGQVLVEKQKDYVTAARALGGRTGRIIFRHVLPNSVAPVLIAATFGVAGAILTESGLSFLGFGVRPPTASWGELLNQALVWPIGYWWLTTWPGFMIFLTVTVYNLVGEGLRDALDPRLKV